MSAKTAPSTAALQPLTPMQMALPYVVLFLLAILLYGNTIPHGYALDDSIVITDNIYTQKGIAGIGKIFTTDAFEGFFKAKKNLVEGGRYRPLSIATFAVEWSLSKRNPQLSHFGNVILYGALGLLLFAFLRMLFPGSDPRKWWLGIPFLITVLFMAHPIHTEVVANIKGRDELMALLFLVGAMIAAFKYVDTKVFLWLPVAFMSFLLALLSKETPLPFVVILPMTLLFFRRNVKVVGYLAASAPIWLATGIYLVIRMSVIGTGTGGEDSQLGTEILNDPFIGTSAVDRLATVMLTWGMYLVKLVVPIQLSHDYYFNQIPVTTFGDPLVLLSMAANVCLLVSAVWLVVKRNAIGYGILFYFISFSITSNLVISIGTTMGERFVFVPSLGFVIALVLGLQGLSQRWKQPAAMKYVFYIVAGITVLFALKTVTRNMVWKDNYTLFTTDVTHSPNSAKARTSAGGAMIDRADDPKTKPGDKTRLLQDAVVHLQAAVKIYPKHGNAWLLLGNAQHKLDDFAASLASYEKCIAYKPALFDAYKNAAITARKIKRYDLAASYYRREIKARSDQDPKDKAIPSLWFDYGFNYEEWVDHADSAIAAYTTAVQLDPKMAKAYGQIGRVYGMQLGNLDQAIIYGEKAIAIDPKLDWVYENVGIATAMKGDPAGAIVVFQRGLAVNPNSAKLYKNLGITYQSLGDPQKAQESFAKAQQLDPNLR
jgi:tetratricopeptide (TPR) repeat protein